MNQPELAFARASDPDTSHEAAKSITGLRDRQTAVLRVLRTLGSGTDVDIAIAYGMAHFDTPPQSASGLRTRRKELEVLGLVVDTGKKATLKSGRKATVWTVA